MTVLKSTVRPAGPVSQCLRLTRCTRTDSAIKQKQITSNRSIHWSSVTARKPLNATSKNSNSFSSSRITTISCRFASSAPSTPESSATKDDTALRQTALYDLHLEYGGKMVPFGGYSMPVQYGDLSVGDSHRWTREKASLFDVGHMVQHILSGPGTAQFLETLTPTSTATLAHHHSTLSCLLHPVTGGIVDDTVITRIGPERFYIVTNAACREKDLFYLTEQLASFDQKTHGAVEWNVRDGWGLVALQGPLSAQVLKDALQYAGADVALEPLLFGQCMEVPIQLPENGAGTSENSGTILISRGGYTGEDGFEIAIPPALTEPFTRLILNSGGGPDSIRFAGLGARDSLRLEAGMCLYGHDLDDSTTPVEAGLSWVVSKDRRATGGFHGAETILRQLRPAKEGGGVERRRVGLTVEGPPAREGAEIVGPEGEEVVGKVTSGCPSPSSGKNIAMGYVRNGLHKNGTEVGVLIRGKRRPAVITKMPFVASKYWKGAPQRQHLARLLRPGNERKCKPLREFDMQDT